MASNTRGSNKRKRDAATNSGTNKVGLEPLLQMSGEQYYRLSYLQILVQLEEQRLNVEEREARIKTLSKRVHDLEHTLVQTKIGIIKQNKRIKTDELNEYRAQIASDLKIKDIDNYLVDNETFALCHMDDII